MGLSSLRIHRPLAVAGVAAIAGVALSRVAPVWFAAALGLVLLGRVRLAPPCVLVLLVALAAGFVAGRRLEARVARTLAAGARARAPPRASACTVEIESCDEDPFRARAWLVGRRADGTGVLCVWAGRLPAGVGSGTRVRVTGHFFLPSPPSNPGERDRRRGLAERGVVMVADLRTAANVETLWRHAPGVRDLLARVRRAAVRRLRRSLPEHVAPLAAALVLGRRSGIPPDDRLLFERTGTMHVLAISGMHVLLLAGLVHAALRALGAGPRAAAAVTLGLALLYVPIAGGAPPIRRAVTVLVFYALALVRGRPPDAASALGGAALVLALADPADVFRPGFRLSFAAAAGIAWLAGPWRERWSRRHRLLKRFPAVQSDRRFRLVAEGYVWRALPVALAAWCATQGLVAQSFGILTPLAPLTNVIVGPVVAILLPCFALVALGAGALALPATLCAGTLRALLETAAAVPGGFVRVATASLPAVLVWCAGCAMLRHRTRLACLLLAGGTLLLFDGPAPPGVELVMFDVGHGQALLVRFDDGRAVLVDAGSRTRPALATRTLLPALRAHGVTGLAAVVCTHDDADHWSALPSLLSALPVERVVVGPAPPAALVNAARRRGCQLERAEAGRLVLATGRARLRILAAATRADDDANESSIALLFEAGGVRALLPADREERGLRELIDRGVPRCDVLVAPHHGARCAAAPELARAVRPRVLLVSAGNAVWDPDTVAAFGAARVCHTRRDGCVTLRFPGAGRVEIETYRPAP